MKYKLTSVADCLFSLSSDYLSNQYSYGKIFTEIYWKRLQYLQTI